MVNEKTEQLLTEILSLLKPSRTSVIFGSSTTTGSFLSGASKISIRNSGGANATITSNGTSYTLEPDEIISLEGGITRINNLITFDATGTTIKYIIYY